MLSNALVYPTLPAVNLQRARKFYEQTLGLRMVMEDQSPGMMFQAGQNCMLYVYQRSATKADHTVADFVVDNLESEMNNLRSKGIKFEDYDLPYLKTVNGIATQGDMKTAWFKDTEGNILGLTQMTPAMMKYVAGQKVGASASG
jgi:catechol 2,3-dioxygenase-like lactoylglutathione lyase family enzyme